MIKTLAQHFDTATGPKRILSLDGGGIRGALSLGLLQKIESLIQQKHNNPQLRLCDYFDMIGGTSTGSIIAAALATGMRVDEIKDRYLQLGSKIFAKKYKWYNPLETMKFLRANYDHRQFETELRNLFGDMTLGDERLLTGLCIITKRADTNSTWPLLNHPGGKFYNSAMGKNKNILLWQAIRASSAAPTYFPPIILDVGDDTKAAFVDGGLSMSNNPALTLLMVATLKGFPLQWNTGEQQLQLISIGTGYGVQKKMTADIDDDTMLNWAANAPDMLMDDACWQNQILLQWLSNSATADAIDLEMNNLKGDQLAPQPLLHYLRYNTELTENSLNAMQLGKLFDEKAVDQLLEMSNGNNAGLLYEIGSKIAHSKISAEHFPDLFLLK
ncbi:MAG: patatin-like phospholipase family protein [Bacteroidota bacterium]